MGIISVSIENFIECIDEEFMVSVPYGDHICLNEEFMESIDSEYMLFPSPMGIISVSMRSGTNG